MSYVPAIPLSGLAGWQFLTRTEETQRAAFVSGAQIEREVAYFKENIGAADTVDKLLEDRTLLSVALGAFGLGDEIDKTAWIRRVLEEGTESEEAFANQLSDTRWQDFSTELGYGNQLGSRVGFDFVVERMVTQYQARSFEIAVGEVDESMRLALNFRDYIGDLVDPEATDLTNWFSIMADQPIREVLDKALNLPAEFSQLDLNKQVEIYADRAQSVLGVSSPADLADPDIADEAIRLYLVRAEIEAGPNQLTPGFGALTLLQAAGSGGQIGGGSSADGLLNLLSSQG
ncbi:MAG: DUF1217 domain-containing protein [Pseudomonadota bacterium]